MTSLTLLQVESNDKLYGQNKKYLAQVDEVIDIVIVKTISYLDAIGKSQNTVSLDVAEMIFLRFLLFLIPSWLDNL